MANKKPQRLIITYPFPLGGANGGARMTREIACHIASTGCEVILLIVNISFPARYPRRPAGPDLAGFEFDEDLAARGVRIQRIDPHRRSRWLDGREIRKAVEAIIEREPVDAVLSYYQEGGYLTRLLRRHNIPFGYICTWQSYKVALDMSSAGWRRPFLELAAWRTVIRPMQKSAILFATSSHTRGELIDVVGVDPEKIRICYLGVGEKFFSIKREQRQSSRRVFFFGRLIEQKGIRDALYACSQLSAQGIEDWEFHLFGSGNRDWVRNLAIDMGIDERVFVNKPLGDEELLQELAKADVAILPSHIEAFGLAFAEAQAAGVPVVAYHAGSVPEVVRDGCSGWLAPVHDQERLAHQLAVALADPAELYRRGKAGRAWVQDRFKWQHTAATILDGLAGTAKMTNSL